MLFGLLVSKPSLVQLSDLNKPSYLQLLASTAVMENIEVIVFSYKKVHWPDYTVSGLVFNLREKTWKFGYTPFPDVIYDRATLDFREEDKIAAEYTRTRLNKVHHVPFINNINFFDKWKTYQALVVQPELIRFLPDTRLYRGTSDLIHYLNRYGIVYVKPSVGSNGRNVFKVRHSKNGRCSFSYREKGKNRRALLTPEEFHNSFIKGRLAGKRIMVQQGINLESLNQRPFDMRVRVQKNAAGNWEIVGNWVRIAAPGSVVTNSSNGGSGDKSSEILPLYFPQTVSRINTEIESLVYSACKRLEESFGRLGDLGFDVALDQAGKLWILEVNAKPTNVWHSDGSGSNRFINPVRYAKHLWEKRQKNAVKSC